MVVRKIGLLHIFFSHIGSLWQINESFVMRELHRKLRTGDHVQGLDLVTALLCETGLHDHSYKTPRSIKTWR